MNRLKSFLAQSFIGGALVLLPITLLFIAFRWAFQLIGELIQPLADPILAKSPAPEFVVDIFVIILIILGCFIIGTITSTGIGAWIQRQFEGTLTKLAPGYNLIRAIVHQIIGDKSGSSFTRGDVARAKIFGKDCPTEVTAIVTSKHTNGWYTLFVPTGPNPTSGMIYHLPADCVELLPHIKVDEALRTIIACGAGSGELFAGQERQLNESSGS